MSRQTTITDERIKAEQHAQEIAKELMGPSSVVSYDLDLLRSGGIKEDWYVIITEAGNLFIGVRANSISRDTVVAANTATAQRLCEELQRQGITFYDGVPPVSTEPSTIFPKGFPPVFLALHTITITGSTPTAASG